MGGEGGVIVAGVQLGAGRGSIHLQGASCLWDYWLLSDYHYPSSGGTFFVFQVRKSCRLSSVTRGSKSEPCRRRRGACNGAPSGNPCAARAAAGYQRYQRRSGPWTMRPTSQTTSAMAATHHRMCSVNPAPNSSRV